MLQNVERARTQSITYPRGHGDTLYLGRIECDLISTINRIYPHTVAIFGV